MFVIGNYMITNNLSSQLQILQLFPYNIYKNTHTR